MYIYIYIYVYIYIYILFIIPAGDKFLGLWFQSYGSALASFQELLLGVRPSLVSFNTMLSSLESWSRFRRKRRFSSGGSKYGPESVKAYGFGGGGGGGGIPDKMFGDPRFVGCI